MLYAVCSMRRAVSAAAAAGLIILSAVLAHAQSASVTGVVLDPDGKVVVDAAVVVRSDGAGIVRAVVTDGRGRFTVSDLPDGTYVVEVSAPGFELVRRTGVALTGGGTSDVSIQLS